MSKTASEILIKISQDVENIKKNMELLNFQYKLILDNLNKMSKNINNNSSNINNNSSSSKYEAAMYQANINPNAGTVTATEEAPMANPTQPSYEENNYPQPAAEEEKFNFTEIIATNNKTENENADKIVTVPVTQLLYKNNKPMSLAQIQILDNKNNIVHKTRTNSAGRWQGLIPSGKYKLKVLRRYEDLTIDYTQDIIIGPSSQQIEILPPEQYRKTSK